MNQCDGCQAGLPLEDGLHIAPSPGGKFGCTKDRYTTRENPKVKAFTDAYEKLCIEYGIYVTPYQSDIIISILEDPKWVKGLGPLKSCPDCHYIIQEEGRYKDQHAFCTECGFQEYENEEKQKAYLASKDKKGK